MIRLGLLLALTGMWSTSLQAQDYIHTSGPELLSYGDLVQLESNQELGPDLAAKLQAITTTPFINNEAWYHGAKPRPLEVEKIGPTLRVAMWNIERGLELDDILLLLRDKDAFVAKMKEERNRAKATGKRVREIDIEKIPQEIELLKAADVWVLNEDDWGVKRTDYRNVVQELGEALDMNWAYGVEFLEIDAKQLGTDTFDYGEDEATRQELLEEFRVDKDKLRALHGNAVLSRYPIRGARLVPFTVGYDWFKESKIRPLEKGKRQAAKLIGEDLQREVRRGQRGALYVTLDVPEAPEHTITVVSTHLENRTKPKNRRRQMEELLGQVREFTHPVVVAGDFNSTGGNGTPTSVENMLWKRYGDIDFWTTKGIMYTTGLGVAYSAARGLRKLAGIQYRVDPTAANIPGISPNLERGLFKDLESFRFTDGHAFDFRGDPERTSNGKSGTLANSNERGSRGFSPTYNSELIWGKVRVARFKLDWILVKSELEKPRAQHGPFIFEPHFARTLSDLNNCLPEPISDHSPMIVDLPFQEPAKIVARETGGKAKVNH